MSRRAALRALAEEITGCRRCPRLVAWREKVAVEKRRSYAGETYWGRPLPGFGDPDARLLIVGLAPGAHGANRTGRVFTGDRSGDFLYAALHRAGLANQAESVSRDDGLRLRGVFITMPCRCAPPENRPTPAELTRCEPFLEREIALLPGAHTFLALGAIAYRAVLGLSAERTEPRPPDFAHGARARLPDPRREGAHLELFASYHVSQQNTQTGRLTPVMFDRLLLEAAAAAGLV
jgi:uracil-DNA glycosylase family 4